MPVLRWLHDHGFDLSTANTNGADHHPLAKAEYKGHEGAVGFLRELADKQVGGVCRVAREDCQKGTQESRIEGSGS